MALSNAERQARYRQRLKRRAAEGGVAIKKLNEAYAAAAAEERARILREIRTEIESSTDREFVRAMERMIAGLPPPSYAWTLDDWCDVARQVGQKDEQAALQEEREEALHPRRERPRRPWAPFARVAADARNRS